jgi:hypothetical protein
MFHISPCEKYEYTRKNLTICQQDARHFLIPWIGGALAPLGPLLCPTTEEKKRPIAPKPGPYDLY